MLCLCPIKAMRVVSLLLFALFMLAMMLVFLGQFVYASERDSQTVKWLEHRLGKRRLDILLSLFPSRLFPETLLSLTRLFSLVAAILIGLLFVYFVLSVMATYLDFNPFGIVSGIPKVPIPNR